jgi:hypothetical protein
VSVKKRAKYRRSTPVGRLRRNVAKISDFTRIVLNRLRSWTVPDKSSAQKIVGKSVKLAEAIALACSGLDEQAVALERSGFAPPKKPTDYQPAVGDRVKIQDACRPKYAMLFEEQLKSEPRLFDDLLVTKVLPTGEVLVRRGRRAPFVARKTHLSPLKVA